MFRVVAGFIVGVRFLVGCRLIGVGTTISDSVGIVGLALRILRSCLFAAGFAGIGIFDTNTINTAALSRARDPQARIVFALPIFASAAFWTSDSATRIAYAFSCRITDFSRVTRNAFAWVIHALAVASAALA